jgi:hypothetical protein
MSAQKMQQLGRSARGGLKCLAFWCALFAGSAHADFATDLAKAAAPVSDGVPEVAIVRLQSLLKTSNRINDGLPLITWRRR